MANQEVKIFFKVEGIDGYITDLDDLQKALSGADKDTKDLSKSTDTLTKETEKSVTSINSLNEELNKLQKELNETEVGSDAFEKLQGQIKDVESELDNAKKGQASFTDTLGEAPGAVGSVTKSVKGLGTAFKALLANPVVLTISLIVAGLTALFKAFTSTKEGGEAFDRVLAGISAAVDVVRDRVLVFADAIGKFFSGDFAGAFNTAKEAVSGIGAEIAAEAQEAARLTGVLQKNTDALRELDVERAEQNALLAENKKRIDDTTLSIEERQQALNEAGASETALLEKELKLENERLAALEALAEQSDSDAETLDEIAQQRIRIAQLEEQSLNKQTELLGKQKALTAEQAALDKAAADEAERLRKEREDAAAAQLEAELKISEEIRRKKLDDEQLALDDLRLKYEEQKEIVKDNEELLAQLEKQYDADVAETKKKFDDEEKAALLAKQQEITNILDTYAETEYANEQERILAELALQYDADRLKLEQAGATADQLAELDKAYQDKVTAQTKKGEDERAKLRKENAIQGVQLFSDVLGAFQELNNARSAKDEKEAKRQFERNKKLSIAQALISTGLAVNTALTGGGNLLKAATGQQFVEAGIALATGLAQVAKIRATEFNGGSVGSDSIEQPTFNPQAAIDTRNQELGGLQNAGEEVNLGGTTPQPIKAYVVSTEVQSGLEANAQIENLSRL